MSLEYRLEFAKDGPVKVVESDDSVTREFTVDFPNDIEIERVFESENYFIVHCARKITECSCGRTDKYAKNKIVAYLDFQGCYLPYGTKTKFFSNTIDLDKGGILHNLENPEAIIFERIVVKATADVTTLQLPDKTIDRHVMVKGNNCLVRIITRGKKDSYGCKNNISMYCIFDLDQFFGGQELQFKRGKLNTLCEERGGYIYDNHQITDLETLNVYNLSVKHNDETLLGFAVSNSGHKVLYAGIAFDFIYECYMYVFDPDII